MYTEQWLEDWRKTWEMVRSTKYVDTRPKNLTPSPEVAPQQDRRFDMMYANGN